MDMTAGTALLSSFYKNVTVGLSLCHIALFSMGVLRGAS
jgi:hypothetical protein